MLNNSVVKLYVLVNLLVPRQALLAKHLQEWVRIKLFYVEHARFPPYTLEEHQGSCHGRHAGSVAHALHARLVISVLMSAVVINIIGVFFPILQTSYTATY